MARLPTGLGDKLGGARGVERVKTELNLIPVSGSNRFSTIDKSSGQGPQHGAHTATSKLLSMRNNNNDYLVNSQGLYTPVMGSRKPSKPSIEVVGADQE